MAYGETFKVGDRVAFENFGYNSFGTITHVLGPDRYLVRWDDGFTEDADPLYSYSADELTAEDNIEA